MSIATSSRRTPAGEVVLEVRSVSKSFGPVEALKDISLKIRAGSVHTLLGENGAGKSTLMKILAGVHPPTRGELFIDGAEVRFDGPSSARQHGIAIVYQELSLANNLSVADNLFANHPPARRGVVDEARMLDAARRLLADLKIPIAADLPVGQLSIAQRQLVEIAKALNVPARIVIMDEPTSSLSDKEAEILFGIIERLTAEGKAVVYISHRMEEIMRISNELSVMRDGQYVCTLRREETTIDALIALMVGRPMRDIYPKRTVEVRNAPVPRLAVKALSCPARFENVSFEVQAGEVLGFFGLVGAGRSDVMDTLFGVRQGTGQILLDGAPVKLRSPAEAIRRGFAFVTENRKEQGLVLDQSVEHNITMVHVQQGRNGAWLTDPDGEADLARRFVDRMAIKISHLHQSVRELSGGNQQKIVFAKWLAMKPTVLVLDEPTRGVDVGAKFEIYNVIRELAAAGTAVILVSSELPEVLAMSDRLVVMREKRSVRTFDTRGLSTEAVMAAATGAQT